MLKINLLPSYFFRLMYFWSFLSNKIRKLVPLRWWWRTTKSAVTTIHVTKVTLMLCSSLFVVVVLIVILIILCVVRHYEVELDFVFIILSFFSFVDLLLPYLCLPFLATLLEYKIAKGRMLLLESYKTCHHI
jgi:hypothetical protein